MAKKKKKEGWEIVIKDRFLTNEKPDNLYLTVLLYFVVFLLSFILIFVCLFQLCKVQGRSMLNTLEDGEHVLLLKISNNYKYKDIVVITRENEDETTTNIIKRVIGVEGDTLKFVPKSKADDAVVDLYIKHKGENEFSLLDESEYIKEPMLKNKRFPANYEFGTEIEIKEKELFVMGDNRNESVDSREGPTVYTYDNVLAKSVLTVPKGSILEYFLVFLYRENTAPTSDN